MTTSATATIIQSALLKTRVFPRPSPSLFFFPGLNTMPIFKSQALHFAEKLRISTPLILEEYKHLRFTTTASSYDTGEHKLHKGQWEWNSYIDKGNLNPTFQLHCPNTVSILESLDSPRLMKETPFSFSFFSTMKGQSAITPHHGPCNIRIRCHLPLIVPQGDCGFRVGNQSIVSLSSVYYCTYSSLSW